MVPGTLIILFHLTLLRAELCPPQILMLKTQPQVPQTVTVFEDRVTKRIIKVK